MGEVKILDNISTYSLIGFPDALGIAFVLISLSLSLAPWLGGKEIGPLKVPRLNNPSKIWFRTFPPIIFLVLSAGFLPIWTEDRKIGTQSSVQEEMKRPLITEITGKDGAPMLLISEGEFIMGSDKGEFEEKPAHRVFIKDFFLDKFEVTTQRYQKFLDATDHSKPEYWSPSIPVNQGSKPVVGVSWFDAKT